VREKTGRTGKRFLRQLAAGSWARWRALFTMHVVQHQLELLESPVSASCRTIWDCLSVIQCDIGPAHACPDL
jgi:Fe-S cluster biosynthesis and repair protein YggX